MNFPVLLLKTEGNWKVNTKGRVSCLFLNQVKAMNMFGLVNVVPEDALKERLLASFFLFQYASLHQCSIISISIPYLLILSQKAADIKIIFF